jgi:hypothetical protein
VVVVVVVVAATIRETEETSLLLRREEIEAVLGFPAAETILANEVPERRRRRGLAPA